MVPYADFNLLKFPDRDAALLKIRDLTTLSDILPTGYHGAVSAGVGPGSTVYIAGAGPVGLAAAASAQLLGAAVVIVGDVNPVRLKHARKVGFQTVNLSLDAHSANRSIRSSANRKSTVRLTPWVSRRTATVRTTQRSRLRRRC